MKKIGIFLILLIALNSCVQDDDNVIQDFYMYPNPFSAAGTGNATFRIVLSQAVISVPVTITIIDQNNQLIWVYSESLSSASQIIPIVWWGENNNGITLAPGVYLVKASVGGGLTGEMSVEILII